MALKCVEQQANRACLLSPQYEDGQPKRFIRQMTSFFVINNITADRHVAYLLAALPSKIYKGCGCYQRCNERLETHEYK